MPEPRDAVEQIERGVELPEGSEERFSGYGVMGLPFASGHILALRRFPASSVGPGYKSVWHRDPEGRWTFYQDVPAQQSCPRYFGSAIAEVIERDIGIEWTGERSFTVTVDGEDGLDWEVTLAPTLATRAMNAVGSIMPDALWRRGEVLSLMGATASIALGAGKLGMTGRAPNGQEFIANPLVIWSIPESRARVRGQDLGPVGPVQPQARLGDFWIPNSGIFVLGRAFFEPFDEARHRSVTSQAAG